MLSISEFSELCGLSPQTMRYYHAEGLLVPAEVDDRNGYRSYAFSQVEQAMLITILRGSGLSVNRVRRVLDQPAAALNVLYSHRAEMQREREEQDAAMLSAEELLTSPREVRRRRVAQITVVSALVPEASGAHSTREWDATAAAATAEELSRRVTSSGGVVTGTPWRILEARTGSADGQIGDGEGPRWAVKVPIDAASIAALPSDLEVREVAAADELFVFVPGKSSMATYATAVSRLLAHPLDSAYIDVGRMRHVLHDDGVETAAALRELAL